MAVTQPYLENLGKKQLCLPLPPVQEHVSIPPQIKKLYIYVH